MFGRRILLLVPHPDDEVVGCCAAIGRARAGGAAVFALYLTTGVPDPAALWRWDRAAHPERVQRRRLEALRVAERLGIRPVAFLDTPTRRLKDELAPALAAARAAVAEHDVDMVWAPAWEGGHQDHDSANFLASRLGDLAPVWEFAEYNRAGGTINAQSFPDGGEGLMLSLSPDEVALKREALAMYPSETGNLGYVGTARERFRPLPAHDYARPPHAGRTFYQRFQWVPFRHPRVDFTTPEEVCAALQAFSAGR